MSQPSGPAPTPPPRRRALPVITQNRLFILILGMVFFAFLLSVVGLAVLAIIGKEPPSKLQEQFANACDFTWKTTLGALVGLLGGRAAGPDRLEVPNNNP
jgi:hypothetical protein